MHRVYLDANATTPLDPRVKAEMVPWLDCGNASSPHSEGRAARAAIDGAREQVAALIGAQPREVMFTSGATEANAIALIGTIRTQGIQRVFCSAVEHPSVLRTLEALDVELVVGAVDGNGRIAEDVDLEAAGLVSVMLANNETGSVQPVSALAARAPLMHTDAVQACGKMRVDVNELGIHMLSLSAHKMHGPKGAGALYLRRGTRCAALFHGGEHERGMRAGNENVAAIGGLGAAAELALTEMDERREMWSRLSARFIDRLRDQVPRARVNSPADRIPNTISVLIPGVEGEAVLLALDLDGVAVATGSACSSGAAEPSHVLQAIGLTRRQAEQSIRVSLHAHTTQADIDACLDSLVPAVKKLRALHV